MINIPLLIRQRELIDTEYIIKNYGPTVYSHLLNTFGSLQQAKHELGLIKGLYTGNYDSNTLSSINDVNGRASTHRLVDANGITPDVIGRMTRNGRLTGPYNHSINIYEKPYVPQTFSVGIEWNGHGLYTSPTDTIKAALEYYGEAILDQFKAYDDKDEIINLGSEIDFNAKKDDEILNVQIKGKFKGYAGSYNITAAGGSIASEYYASVMQPGMIINNKYVIRDSTQYQNGGARKQLDINTKRENQKDIQLLKQDLAFLIAIINGEKKSEQYGHDIKIEFPLGDEVDNLREIIMNGARHEMLTLINTLENPYLPGSDTSTPIENEIFNQVGGEIMKLFYIDQLPMRQVDNIILDKYWDLILTPKVLWDLILNQEPLEQRIWKTACMSGSVILGNLTTKGTSLPYTPPVYSTQPAVINNEIHTPIPSGHTTVNNGAANIDARITFYPCRAYKLYECRDKNFMKDANIYTTCYGGYLKNGYKPAILTDVMQGQARIPSDIYEPNSGMPRMKGQFNPDFYEHPEKYKKFYEKQAKK